MKVFNIALFAAIAVSDVNAAHVKPGAVTQYNMCTHDEDCASTTKTNAEGNTVTEKNKCCQAVKEGGDGVMLLRCGPWIDYSGYTGTINNYMYKCNDNADGAAHLAATSFVLSATALAALY